jgi:hypothetical protein
MAAQATDREEKDQHDEERIDMHLKTHDSGEEKLPSPGRSYYQIYQPPLD